MAEGAAASAGAASLGVSSSAETSVSRHRSNQNIFVPQQQPPRQLLPAAADPALNPRRTVPVCFVAGPVVGVLGLLSMAHTTLSCFSLSLFLSLSA